MVKKSCLCLNIIILAAFFKKLDGVVPSYPSFDTQVIAEGKKQFEILAHDARLPYYGDCWSKAMQGLTEGCKYLTEDVQARLALSFTNCLLLRAGQETHPCPVKKDISSCLSVISGNAFTAYANFFTHTHSMCHYLQSQLWQESTENTIERLTANSADLNEQLTKFRVMQSEMLVVQNKALSKQTKLMRNMETSKDTIHKVLKDFQSSTEVQKTLIFEVVDKLSNLQSLFFNEFSGFMTFLYYGLAIILCFLITSTNRSISARLPIFLILTITATAEYCLQKSHSPSSLIGVYINNAENLYETVWMLRKISIAISLFTLLYSVLRYRDINRLNNALLDEIRRQNVEIKNHMYQIGSSYKVDTFCQSLEDNLRKDLEMRINQLSPKPCIQGLTDNAMESPLSKKIKEVKTKANRTPYLISNISTDQIDTPESCSPKKRGRIKIKKTFNQEELFQRSPSPYNLRARKPVVLKEVTETAQEFFQYVTTLSSNARRNSFNRDIGFKSPKDY